MRKTSFKWLPILLTYVLIMGLAGCINGQAGKLENEDTETSDLIYESTFCPNEQYVQREENKIYNTVRIYQADGNRVIVSATSNSLFFDGVQYEYECEEKLTADDIGVRWLTIMGSEIAVEDDQLVVAEVTLSVNGEIQSKRKINFATKAIEIISDFIPQYP